MGSIGADVSDVNLKQHGHRTIPYGDPDTNGRRPFHQDQQPASFCAGRQQSILTFAPLINL